MMKGKAHLLSVKSRFCCQSSAYFTLSKLINIKSREADAVYIYSPKFVNSLVPHAKLLHFCAFSFKFQSATFHFTVDLCSFVNSSHLLFSFFFSFFHSLMFLLFFPSSLGVREEAVCYRKLTGLTLAVLRPASPNLHLSLSCQCHAISPRRTEPWQLSSPFLLYVARGTGSGPQEVTSNNMNKHKGLDIL